MVAKYSIKLAINKHLKLVQFIIAISEQLSATKILIVNKNALLGRKFICKLYARRRVLFVAARGGRRRSRKVLRTYRSIVLLENVVLNLDMQRGLKNNVISYAITRIIFIY